MSLEAHSSNRALPDLIQQFALQKNASPAQIALAWVLAQLPKKDKILIYNKLRAEISLEQWLALSKQLPDVPEIRMDEIISEVKAVRSSKQKRS